MTTMLSPKLTKSLRTAATMTVALRLFLDVVVAVVVTAGAEVGVDGVSVAEAAASRYVSNP